MKSGDKGERVTGRRRGGEGMDREGEKKNELRKKRIMKELVGKGGLDGRGRGKSGVGVDAR